MSRYEDKLHDEIEELRALARRMAVELQYVQAVCPEGHSRNSPLCASSEGLACIADAEALLGPMRDWPETKEASRG